MKDRKDGFLGAKADKEMVLGKDEKGRFMGRWDVQLEGWTRIRHAKRCTILRICSGANPVEGLEVSGI